MGSSHPVGSLAIRRLWPSDLPALHQHLLRLETRDRVSRFGGHIADEALEAYVNGIDWSADALVGAFVAGELRGIAEVRRPALFADAGELALCVERAYQGVGVGTQLVGRITLAAKNLWTRKIFFLCDRSNHPVRKIGKKFHAELDAQGYQILGRLSLGPPTPLSVLLEGCEEWLARTDGPPRQ